MLAGERAPTAAPDTALVDEVATPSERVEARGTPHAKDLIESEPAVAPSRGSGPPTQPVPPAPEIGTSEVDGGPTAPDAVRQVPVAPSAATPVTGSHASQAVAITEFVPAHVDVVGNKDVLDQLPGKAAAALVLEQVLDVIEAEGPIELSRLARIVARRFGLNAVRAARVDDILRLIPRAQLRKSRKLGDFAWPSALDPETWTGFRIAGSDGSRTLHEIAPQEIANAMLAVLGEFPELEHVDDLLRRTAELFGIVRLGANVRSRLEAVYKALAADEGVEATSSEPAASDIPAAASDAPPTGLAEKVGLDGSPTGSGLAEHGAYESDSTPVEVPSTPDAVIEAIASEVDGYVPDLSRVEDYMYYDYIADSPMRPELKRLVNEIVIDPTYDGGVGNEGIIERAMHLSVEDQRAVTNAASMVWGQTIGTAYRGAAARIAVHLAQDPDFDPLPWEEDINDFVASRMANKPPGLVMIAQRELNAYANEKGLIARVEAEIQRDAREALSQMTPLERDIYGFTSRNAKRLQLAEPYLSRVKQNRRKFVVYWMSRFESEELGLKREARYATAVRRLAAQGHTRAAISRALGISTSVMDRIERENRNDIPLESDDPIVTKLAPSIR